MTASAATLLRTAAELAGYAPKVTGPSVPSS